MDTNKPDRTEDAFRLNEQLKQRKWRGKIILHHDESLTAFAVDTHIEYIRSS